MKSSMIVLALAAEQLVEAGPPRKTPGREQLSLIYSFHFAFVSDHSLLRQRLG